MAYPPVSLAPFVDGIGPVATAAWFNYVDQVVNGATTTTFTAIVPSITALRATSKAQFVTALVFGYYSPGDGGGGDYWYDSSDTTSTDNGGAVIVATDGGRWKLSSQTTISVKQFGAVGNGVANDTVAVQNASTALAGKVLYFPSGTYSLSSSISFAPRILLAAGAQLLCADASKTFLFSAGLDAPLTYCLNLAGYVQVFQTPQLLPQWFGAMGDAVYCAVNMTSGSAVASVNIPPPGLSTPAFANGDTIFVRGAGAGGALLSTTISSGGGTNTLTLGTAALTSVTNAEAANRDNTTALQRFFAAFKGAGNISTYGASIPSITGCSKGYFPHGVYTAFALLNVYSASVYEGEYGNTIGGAILCQCNYSSPLLNVIADNFDASGNTFNGGSGNNIFRNLGFKSASANDAALNSPVVFFQNAWNIASDTEFDHCLWQDTAGAAIGAGFQTTGSITNGSSTLTLVNGATLRNGNNAGGRVTVRGAGVSGADLVTYITAGGGTNTVTLNTAASTTVTNAVVVPTSEAVGLKIVDCEFDVCRAGIEFSGNVGGSTFIRNLEAFEVVRGAIRNTSTGDMVIDISDSFLDGCGNQGNGTAAYRRSIYFDTGGTTNGRLRITSCRIETLPSTTFGGPIYAQCREAVVTDNVLTNLDTTDNEKFCVLISAVAQFSLNLLNSSALASYTTSRLVGFYGAATQKVSAVGNIVEQSGGTVAVCFDAATPLSNAMIVGNKVDGTFSAAISTNLAQSASTVPNGGYGPRMEIGTAAPGVGAYSAGDLVFNSGITNSSGQAVGFVCVVGGAPGTWRSFGVTL